MVHSLRVKYSLSTHNGTYFVHANTFLKGSTWPRVQQKRQQLATSILYSQQVNSLPAPESSSKIFWKTFRRTLSLRQSVSSSCGVTSASWGTIAIYIERLQLRHGYDVIRTSVWQKIHSGSTAAYRKLLLRACWECRFTALIQRSTCVKATNGILKA